MQDKHISETLIPRMMNNGTPTPAGIFAVVVSLLLILAALQFVTGSDEFEDGEAVMTISWTNSAGEIQTEEITIALHRAEAPIHVENFILLSNTGKYDDVLFHRVIDGFMIQFGIHGDPSVVRNWKQANVIDDPVTQSNSRGYLSFAKTGQPNSRTTQLFINLGDNSRLDKGGFAPFAQVIQGMDIVDQIYKVGEGAPRGPGPSQRRIQLLGNDYLKKNFPKIDYINRAWFTE